MIVMLLHPDATPEHLGILPHMLSEDDPNPAKQQFHAAYPHGGGWQPISGFKLKGRTLHYPGDPAFEPIAMMTLRDETILFYQHAIVAIIQQDGSFEAARMD